MVPMDQGDSLAATILLLDGPRKLLAPVGCYHPDSVDPPLHHGLSATLLFLNGPCKPLSTGGCYHLDSVDPPLRHGLSATLLFLNGPLLILFI